MQVRAKKSLGQHFLKDKDVAKAIVDALKVPQGEVVPVLEVGPGTGVLTSFLLERGDIALRCVELDPEAVAFLQKTYFSLGDKLIYADFLKLDIDPLFDGKYLIIGNFPYNISSQIFFKVLASRDRIPQVVGMVQKEVAQRISAPPGNKTYGILSVLLQAWYDIDYLFSVPAGAFAPPPKVTSAVIRLRRNARMELGCEEALFKAVVKTSFGQRRKTLRNSLKPLLAGRVVTEEFLSSQVLDLRPERLSVEDFIALTNSVAALEKSSL